MFTCNNCGKNFENPENDACPHCGSGDYFEETATIEQVVADADEKNKEKVACSLRDFGEQYIKYKNAQEMYKQSVKEVVDMAEEQGITKEMLIAYANAIQLADFNKKVLCSAVQEQLDIEKQLNTPIALDKEDEDVQQEEQSDNQSGK